MFEAVVMLCAALAGGSCRDALLPGYEAPTREACEAALLADPPDRDGATCRPTGPALTLTRIAPGVFAHRGAVAEPDEQNRGDVSNIGVVIGEASVAVIDSGGSAEVGEALWRAIRAQTDLPVTYVILTHMHPDHVYGASVFPGAEVIGHSHLPRALADRQESYRESFSRLIGPAGFAGARLPEVDRGIDGTAVLDLGGRRLDLRAWPTAHSSTDLTVFDRESGTLFAGDLVFDSYIPALDGSLRGWQAVTAELQRMEIARLVPGHGGPVLDWPEGGDAQADYLDLLARDAEAEIASGARLADAVPRIGQGAAGDWALFDAFNARNATVAFTELEWE